jgi:very-short-patch-repair endonuclease
MTQNVRRDTLPHHRARRLRREQTEAETKLWSRLRAKGLEQFRFRRQFAIGNFIADFACPEAGLVIELDGGHHLDQAARDNWRTELIEQRGFRVIRFWDNEVLTGIDDVIEKIAAALRQPSP